MDSSFLAKLHGQRLPQITSSHENDVLLNGSIQIKSSTVGPDMLLQHLQSIFLSFVIDFKNKPIQFIIIFLRIIRIS